MDFSAIDAIEEALSPIKRTRLVHLDNKNIIIRLTPMGSLVGLNVRIAGAKVKIVLPDSLAYPAGHKSKIFDLHNPDALPTLATYIEDLSQISICFDSTDRKVIIDAFAERLPMVWQDGSEEIKKGRNIDIVLDEMKTGHVLRVLKRCGYDVESWLSEFEEFHNDD